MLTQARLKQLLEYDPETGDFWWKVGAYNGRRADLSRGRYREITVWGNKYQAHRAAVLWMTGEWPKDQVDHIDGNGQNNKWKNLREATRSQNQANSRMYRNNKSGFRGVAWISRDNKYLVQIGFNGKQLNLGYFSSPEDAARAYDEKAKELFGEFAKLNFPS